MLFMFEVRWSWHKWHILPMARLVVWKRSAAIDIGFLNAELYFGCRVI